MDRSVLQGLAAFRWGAWAWMAVALVASWPRVARPVLAMGLVALALVLTAASTMLWRTRPESLVRPGPVVAEVAVGFALVLCDGVAYGRGHAFTSEQSLGTLWPLAGVLAAGVALGPAAGAGAGVALGVARTASVVLNGADLDQASRLLSLAGTTVYYGLAGAVAGYLYVLLRRAEREISAARAREEVARTLHDGVLQTLALVERRTGDPALARLAREQERDLREFLFGRRPDGDGDLAAALRACAARFEDAFGGRAEVVVAGELPAVDGDRAHALAGAVGEALTNAGKHGGADRVTVFVDGEDELFCSVKDNGRGADPASMVEGVGISRSIRGRIEGVGGRVEVAGGVGTGMEVRMWLPV